MLAGARIVGIFVAILAVPPPGAQAEGPATVAEAAATLDLSTFPLMPGADAKGPRRLAGLDYPAKGDPRGAYAFQKKALEERGWAEAAGGYLSDQACSGTFVKGGYAVSVSATPSSGTEAAGTVDVRIANHGNVPLDRLPVPPDAKPLYAFPTVASYVTGEPVREAAEAMRALLTARGWEPYGRAGDALFFKKNAIKLCAFLSASPAQGGRTVLQLSAELMSADLPAPPDAIEVAYSDATKALSLEVAMGAQGLLDFYARALGDAGWKAAGEKAAKVDFRDVMIFRNDAQDVLTLAMHEVDGKLRATLEHRTAAEFEEARRLAREREAARGAQAMKPPGMRAAGRAKVAVALPAGAKSVDLAGGRLAFRLAPGEAAAAVKAIHAALLEGGWAGKTPKFEATADSVSLEKGPGVALVIAYIDAGFGDAEVVISAFGVDVEAAAAE